MATRSDATPGSRRRPDEVRKLLLEAAERVVVRKGMAANAHEIALEAGVHRSVLYRHFGTAHDLIQLAALRPFREFLDRIQRMTAVADEAEPTPLRDLMIGFLGDLLEILFDHRDFLLMAMSEASPLQDSHRADLRAQLDAVLDEVTELAIGVGRTRELDIERVRVNMRLAIAMAIGVSSFGSWLLPADEYPPSRAQLIESMANILLHGVRQVPDI